MFDPIFDSPALAGRSLLAFDFFGFGESSKPDGFSYDLIDQTQVLHQALRSAGIKEAVLVGHSLGGMVATLALEELAHAEGAIEVKGLVSLEGNLRLADCGKSAEIAELPRDEFLAQFAQMAAAIEAEGGSGVARARWIRQTSPIAFYKSAKSIVEWSRSGKLFSIFESHPTPKLLVKGAASSFRSNPKGPFTQVVEIPQASHFLLFDSPEAVITEILRFSNGIGQTC